MIELEPLWDRTLLVLHGHTTYSVQHLAVDAFRNWFTLTALHLSFIRWLRKTLSLSEPLRASPSSEPPVRWVTSPHGPWPCSVSGQNVKCWDGLFQRCDSLIRFGILQSVCRWVMNLYALTCSYMSRREDKYTSAALNPHIHQTCWIWLQNPSNGSPILRHVRVVTTSLGDFLVPFFSNHRMNSEASYIVLTPAEAQVLFWSSLLQLDEATSNKIEDGYGWMM